MGRNDVVPMQRLVELGAVCLLYFGKCKFVAVACNLALEINPTQGCNTHYIKMATGNVMNPNHEAQQISLIFKCKNFDHSHSQS